MGRPVSVALAIGVTLISDRGNRPREHSVEEPASYWLQLCAASAQVTDETSDVDQENRAPWVGSPGWGKQQQLHVADGG